MINDNILDAGFDGFQSNSLMDSIDWWERKRFLYNLIIVGLELAIISFFWEGTKRFGIQNAIFGSIAYTVVANIFYSMGWGINVLAYYYKLDFLKTLDKLKLFFFIMGLSVSIVVTISMYAETLYSYQVLIGFGH